MSFTEDLVEQVALGILQELGWRYENPVSIAPDGPERLRVSNTETVLSGVLEAAARRLNPSIPDDALHVALKQVQVSETPSLIEENRRIHRMLVDGVDVEYRRPDGSIKGDKVRLIDFGEPANNDLMVTNQFTVVEGGHNRRPDVVAFVNGLPLVVIELKNAASENATIEDAFNQLQTYKAQIPSLFRTNAALITSDGLLARVGSLSAGEDRFMPWRTVTGAQDDFTPEGPKEMETLLRGLMQPENLLQLVRDFTVFGDKGDGVFKIIAGYHQFHGARKALTSAVKAVDEHGDRKVGVIWHTQGSGKSFLMAFFAGLLVRAPEMQNPTILVVTDRNDLDDQLYGTFSLCRDLVRQTPEQIADRDDLRQKLDRRSGGVIFSTLQKFSPMAGEEDFPMLSDRRNIVVIADEAHRSQYGFDAKLDRTTGARKYGYAHYLRQALPNASFAGFTGTPIEAADVNTPAVFGDYVDVYDISRAVEDKSTVPIYYESRLARVELETEKLPEIDAAVDALFDDETISEQEKAKSNWSSVERLVGAPPRLDIVAQDIVDHFEDRLEAMAGKGMIVCMSRAICVDLYSRITALRPDWHSEDDKEGAIKVVMTGSASDPLEWQQHIGSKMRRDLLAKRARNPADPLKMVIVRDMWLTGFDAPCMHTMYIDKPMRGHGLMQAIARVNRVFKDKPGGLVVDYIGIGQNLKKALQNYTATDRDQTGIDEEEAVAALQELVERSQNFFSGFDYRAGIDGAPQDRLQALAGAMEWALEKQKARADSARDEKAKKAELTYYADLVSNLSKAFALGSASDYAQSVKEEVGFFQAVRAALSKTSPKSGMSKREKEFAIGQLISDAIADASIIDVLAAAGMRTPEISVLSEEFLSEIQNMEHKNLALEALRKLLAGEIKARQQKNVVEAKAFSERLEAAVARYHANAITSLEMIQELIDMAKDLQASVQRGDDLGLGEEELAFYDALAQNESAVEMLGNEELRKIAHVLVEQLQKNVTVDWHLKESARAKLRILVRRILKKYGYPPDLAPIAITTVLGQAETLLKWGT
ncbi:type I restriction endonuclease subunit R [Thalassobacter stenotrophicus]|uniref:Type I restriction enzyme endonuclease subunit n=2 Tax=Thalassobacter stenotrophicus TaxID=266809 RepID=A0A0P1EYX6_9RHOB|nr:type I restriction endonuclease subunit R [Thalassobacter stenotrophicus]CUH60212.1 Type I restriction enzyme EcoR124II R protein [Thalassobacter stenotrophicus]SHI70350.1 type I restriction enzyme, R subunit [Thalassobacter stenotrophicus DSM 16310]